MNCRICSIDSQEVKDAVEFALLRNSGTLFESDKVELIEQFPEYEKAINAITDNDCGMHFNFHQRISRVPSIRKTNEPVDPKAGKNGVSLAADIGKDEAEVLYEILNAQAATFTLLNNRIINQIRDAEKEDGTKMLLHPQTIQFYRETADSIRATVKAIESLNISLNGQKDGSLDGLFALAAALDTSRKQAAGETKKTHPFDNPEDGTTTMFD